jgi:G:T-mismatch repair DNA endonuclease (very short patch repair protein)
VQKAATISPTSIEVDAYRALDELGIAYKPQHRLGSFVIDALIEDRKIAVEVQGDYWHCNPTKYPNGPQDEKQRRGVEKDKRRFEWLKSKGYQVIELWESDIRSVGAKALLEKALSI